MKKPFPIFVDVEAVPPLVVGNAEGLVAKIRLLLKFAPVVDVITDMPAASYTETIRIDTSKSDSVVRVLNGVSCADAESHITGRPLVILDTMNERLNESLSAAAKAMGVPVNVPDQIALCSFYLASIVDRAPVTVAISTSGVAPVLGQNIRAKIEDMLGPKIGDLAHYLWSLRDQLRHLPAAMRRSIQHQIIDGPISRHLQFGNKEIADAGVIKLLAATTKTDDAKAVTLIEAGTGSPGLLSLDAVAGIRSADVIFFDGNVSAEVLDLARREANLIACLEAQPNQIIGQLEEACRIHQQVIYLIGGNPAWHHNAHTFQHALDQYGMSVRYIASARDHTQLPAGDAQQPPIALVAQSGAQVIKGAFR